MDEPLSAPVDPDGRTGIGGRAGGSGQAGGSGRAGGRGQAGGRDSRAPGGPGGLILRGADLLASGLRAVAREPRTTALFCDIDGTISPIVDDPYAAVVPDTFRAALTALAPRLGLLAFVTGRDVRQAAAMVGVAGTSYVGLHGFDQMAPDGTVARDPAAEGYVDRVQTMARRVATLDAGRLGLVVENKGPMLDLHYRRAPDPAATVAVLEAEILGPARALGLAIATGHFLVELRPPEPVSKGTAVGRLLLTGGRGGVALRTAIFVGDDLTDCTGFAAVHEWADEAQPVGEARSAARVRTHPTAAEGDAPAGRVAVAVAALTDETPRRVADEADVVVAATPGVYRVLTALLEVVGA